LPNPAWLKPCLSTSASQKPSLQNPALRKPGYPIQLWETCFAKSGFAQIGFTESYFAKPGLPNWNPLTFCGRFQQIIKVGRKGPEAPTTGHPSSKPPHEVWQHPVGYIHEMLDAWSTLMDYDGDPSFFLANSIFFKNVPTGFFPFFTPYVEK
jgi:hypothetical protein